MKARAAGAVLWLLLVAPAAIAALGVLLRVVAGPIDQAKGSLRALDVLASTGLFGAPAGVSLSAWSWERRTTWWARLIIAATNRLQPGHCELAWRQEMAGEALRVS